MKCLSAGLANLVKTCGFSIAFMTSAEGVSACQPNYQSIVLGDILEADLVVAGDFLHVRQISVTNPVSGRTRQYDEYLLLVGDFLSRLRPFEVRPRRIWIDLEGGIYRFPDDQRVASVVVALDRSGLIPRIRPSVFGERIELPAEEIMTIHGQSPCKGGFMFDASSEAGRAIVQIFDGRGNAQAEVEVFAEFLRMNGETGLY